MVSRFDRNVFCEKHGVFVVVMVDWLGWVHGMKVGRQMVGVLVAVSLIDFIRSSVEFKNVSNMYIPTMYNNIQR